MPEVAYHAVALDTLRLVAADDLIFAYHRASGITHLLAPPAPEILNILAEAPMRADELLVQLAALYDLADGDLAMLVARLDELVAAGLVWRA